MNNTGQTGRELHYGECYFPIGETACRRSSMMSLKSKKCWTNLHLPLSTTGNMQFWFWKPKASSKPSLKRKGKTYKAIDSGEVVQVLEQIWEIYGHTCSKRLQSFLPKAIKVLERCKEIEISQEVKVLLLKISSIDRCLRPVRIKSPYGLSTTKPGSLLKI